MALFLVALVAFIGVCTWSYFVSPFFQIEAFVKGFKLSTLTYKRVMHLLNQEMNNGLKEQTHHVADIKMFPTFVRSLPDGSGKALRT